MESDENDEIGRQQWCTRKVTISDLIKEYNKLDSIDIKFNDSTFNYWYTDILGRIIGYRKNQEDILFPNCHMFDIMKLFKDEYRHGANGNLIHSEYHSG